MERKRLRVVQIGTAHDHAADHIDTMRVLPDDYEVVGVYEPDIARREVAMKRRSYDGLHLSYENVTWLTLEEILGMDDLDAVIIESEEMELVEYAQMFADKGLAIHMDKPCGTDYPAFEKLVETMRSKQLPLHIGYMYRYNAAVKYCLELKKEGKLGDIFSVEAQMSVLHNAEKRAWLKRFKGGMMFFLGCHLVDLVYLMCGEPERVIPYNTSTGNDGVDSEDYAFAVFEYKNGVLVKAVTTLLQMTEDNGDLLYLNDCLEKNWKTTELVWGVDIAYSLTKDKTLLSIAKEQGVVMISKEGAEVSKDINKALPFEHHSINISDGPLGKNGGIGILRTKNNGSTTSLVMKYTSQGMGHGHFDKLSYTFYDNNNEIVKDYGAARFLNIEPKNGGHYLYENDEYAKQTIAHNTLVVDKKSHYNGSLKIGSKYSPSFYAFSGDGNDKMISAVDTNAYEGVKMHRTMFLLSSDYFEYPVMIDVMKVDSKENHIYDMPVHYNGHLINTNYRYNAFTDSRKVLDDKNGYQYYWVEAFADSLSKVSTTTWLCENRFYSLSTITNIGDEIYLNRLGANDPKFNLRHEPCIMHRSNGKNKTFVSAIEIHGEYNPQLEYTLNPYSNISDIILDYDTDEYTIIKIKAKKGQSLTICLSNKNNDVNAEHHVNGFVWKGTYKIFY